MSDFKAGFIAIVGRPNTGKSTLVNALVGTKIVITSHHPNTTRNPIRGIINQDSFQMIVVDTPGMHKPKTALGTRLNSMVNENINSTDAVVLCLPANEDIGAGDEYIAKQIKGRQEVFLVVTKVDTVSKSELAAKLVLVTEFAQKVGQEKAEIIPISAKNLEQTDLLLDLLAKKLPISPALYPTDINTDQVQELMFADLIREAAIEELYEELPHSVMVIIEEMGERDNGKIFDISATLHVERDSQKGIIIGPQGTKLKAIGSTARKSIENIVGLQVFLQIHVKVSKEWQKDPKLLAKLGFTDSLSD
ncbi:GTPase [Candidatus Nanopelagicus abundans]|jgi:GTP-binding protein Era|uniref:GTPase Era n=1 Tax=Candidatus Nanopelagicus abundans TaxID=1884916 RepID=A0A249L500_9ACTN|nr:GTPase Era [Candidatus Nanopelagicus abundans]ASY24009.1 GTPase [Candidatus Nanopelagicus abundans]